MYTKIIYDFYSDEGTFFERVEYYPKDYNDYMRCWNIINEQPQKYRLVNCEYGFAWKGEAYE